MSIVRDTGLQKSQSRPRPLSCAERGTAEVLWWLGRKLAPVPCRASLARLRISSHGVTLSGADVAASPRHVFPALDGFSSLERDHRVRGSGERSYRMTRARWSWSGQCGTCLAIGYCASRRRQSGSRGLGKPGTGEQQCRVPMQPVAMASGGESVMSGTIVERWTLLGPSVKEACHKLMHTV